MGWNSHARRHTAAAALVLAGAFGVTACSGSSSTAAAPPLAPGQGQHLAGDPGSTATGPMSVMPPMTSSSSGATSVAAAAPVAGDAVAIKDFAFTPATLTVKAGTTVTWTNQDTDAHTVTSHNGGPLKSAALATGGTYSYTFATPGTYSYLCTIHPFMTATVLVTA